MKKGKEWRDEGPAVVLIGGTGRCGTTILSRLLASCEGIYAFPSELRFLTDPDGLPSLKAALVDNWSFFQADVAVERFQELLSLVGKRSFGPYMNVTLSPIVGRVFFKSWLRDFVSAIAAYRFKCDWTRRTNLVRKAAARVTGRWGAERLALRHCSYCSPRALAEFQAVARIHLSRFFERVSACTESDVVVDATPSNIMHAKLLLDCVRKAKIIHIYRDPRDVVSSFATRRWGAPSIEQNAVWIADILDRWESIRAELDPSLYMQVKFESLIDATQTTLRSILDFVEVDSEITISAVDLGQHNIGRWRRSFSDGSDTWFQKKYGYLLERYGYS